jgi:hypothetical protein
MKHATAYHRAVNSMTEIRVSLTAGFCRDATASHRGGGAIMWFAPCVK